MFQQLDPIVRRRQFLCWTLVSVVSLLSAVGIAMLAPRMSPIRQGSSREFWKIATGVSLSPEVHDGWGGDAYFVDETWAAYDASHMHGSDIYRVARSDVTADFNQVVSLLEEKARGGEDTLMVKAYIQWRDDKSKPRDGPSLVEHIKREINRKVSKEDVDLLMYRVSTEQQFWQRWQRADLYWASIVFEWVFFTGLAVFCLWPAIQNSSPLRWAIHVALLPFLFLLPVYLGYATYSFTSAGPSGGILYPYLLMFCRHGSSTMADRWVLRRVPHLLEPLSTPIGSPTALTGMGMPGPTYVILGGVLAGAAVFAIMLGIRRWREHYSKSKRAIE
jgi:hypothetical protein